MIGKVKIKISYDRRSSIVKLLVVAMLVATFLGYLLWGQTRVAASEVSQPSLSSNVAQAASTGEARQYYLTLSTAFDGSEAASACAAGYHMASAWELLDSSNLRYNTTLGRKQNDSGEGPPSYYEGWVRTGYNGSTANVAGWANCGVWSSASNGNYGTSLYLPGDWRTGQDLGAWKTGVRTCNTNLPVWCIADQAAIRQYYLTQDDSYVGSQPTTVCATGYHMASLWEILDPSNLRYNVNLGYNRLDDGMGPPAAFFGWIRTGYNSDDGTVNGAGRANCSAWSSGSVGDYGTVVRLPDDWTDSNLQDVSVWDAALRQCSDEANTWCVANAVDGVGTCAIPRFITCGQQVSGNTTGLASHIDSYSCSGWNESGPEVIYSLNLPSALEPYTVTATLSGLAVDLDVFILPTDGCYEGQCLANGNTSATAADLAGGAYYIAVDGFNGVAGSYTLSVDCELRQIYLPLVLRD